MTLPLPVMHPCYFCETVHDRSSRWNVIEYTDLTEREAAAIMTAARRVME